MEITDIAQVAIQEILPQCEVVTISIADGGKGTVACFLYALNGEAVEINVTGPYISETVKSIYGRFGDTAVIEMASATGLPLVKGKGNPTLTTTYGVGELISH